MCRRVTTDRHRGGQVDVGAVRRRRDGVRGDRADRRIGLAHDRRSWVDDLPRPGRETVGEGRRRVVVLDVGRPVVVRAVLAACRDAVAGILEAHLQHVVVTGGRVVADDPEDRVDLTLAGRQVQRRDRGVGGEHRTWCRGREERRRGRTGGDPVDGRLVVVRNGEEHVRRDGVGSRLRTRGHDVGADVRQVDAPGDLGARRVVEREAALGVGIEVGEVQRGREDRVAGLPRGRRRGGCRRDRHDRAEQRGGGDGGENVPLLHEVPLRGRCR